VRLNLTEDRLYGTHSEHTKTTKTRKIFFSFRSISPLHHLVSMLMSSFDMATVGQTVSTWARTSECFQHSNVFEPVGYGL
jgi:hypothetical protein